MNVLAVHCPGSETEGAGESAKVIVYNWQALRCFIITQERHEEKAKLNPNTMTSLHQTEGRNTFRFRYITEDNSQMPLFLYEGGGICYTVNLSCKPVDISKQNMI